jgi:hypothetical protein
MNLTGEEVMNEITEYKDKLKNRLDNGHNVFSQNKDVLAQHIITLESLEYRIKVADENKEAK